MARRQILAAGGTDGDVTRLLRRRELTQVYPGVYVNHSGRLAWTQRQWAGVLAFWPAALAHVSALPDPPTAVLHVAVALGRNPRRLPRIVVHRTPDFETRADLDRSPPAIRLEHALIDVIADDIGREDLRAGFAALARVCSTRRTSPERILRTLASASTRLGAPHLGGDAGRSARRCLLRAGAGLSAPCRAGTWAAGGRSSDAQHRDWEVQLPGRPVSGAGCRRRARRPGVSRFPA